MDEGDHLTITYLTGHFEMEPVKYTLRRMANGEGILESEFMTLRGDYADMLAAKSSLGGHVTLV
jgi:hypothetical protein